MIKAAQNGDREAVTKLFKAHFGYLVSCLRIGLHLPVGPAPVSYYLGELSLVFLRCIARWQPGMGAKLVTYSRKALIRAASRRTDRLVVPPAAVYEDGQVKPWSSETKVLVRRAWRSWKWQPLPAVLSDKRHNGKSHCAPDRQEPEDYCPEWYDKEMLYADLALLGWREQRIVEMRYFDGLTLEEVGKEFRVTKERIRQIECVAIRKLQRRVESRRVAQINKPTIAELVVAMKVVVAMNERDAVFSSKEVIDGHR